MGDIYVVMAMSGWEPHIMAVGDERILERGLQDALEMHEFAWIERWQGGRRTYVSPIYDEKTWEKRRGVAV